MSNSISNISFYTLPAGSKKDREAAYKKHVATNPDIVLDAAGLPLTNEHYLEGFLRPPTGMKTKGARLNSNPNFVVNKLIVQGVHLLSADAKTWNDTVYKTAAEQLYAILARVYALHQSVVNAEKNVKAVREAVWDYAVNKQNLKVKSSTSNICLLVSCVFKTVPPQRRSAYGLGLQTLINNFGPNLSEAEVVQHILDAGGIYELAHPEAAPKPDTASSIKLKNEEVQALASKLKSNVLLTLDSTPFAGLLANANTPYLAIVTKDDAGQIAVRAICDSDACVISATKASFEEPKVSKQPPKKPKKPKKPKSSPKKLSKVFAEIAKDPEFAMAA